MKKSFQHSSSIRKAGPVDKAASTKRLLNSPCHSGSLCRRRARCHCPGCWCSFHTPGYRRPSRRWWGQTHLGMVIQHDGQLRTNCIQKKQNKGNAHPPFIPPTDMKSKAELTPADRLLNRCSLCLMPPMIMQMPCAAGETQKHRHQGASEWHQRSGMQQT